MTRVGRGTSKEFGVEFNAEWTAGESLVVGYAATTVTGAVVTFSRADGSVLGDSGVAQIGFTPPAAAAGGDVRAGRVVHQWGSELGELQLPGLVLRQTD
ncbi:hypothetical protein DIPPA_29455 [Diplonema papillatum]|nr:hypothetical protein DIPPA_29455 [Diplonema papillatum]